MGEHINEMVKRLRVPGEFINFNEALIFKVEAETGLKVWKIYPGFSLTTIIKYQELTNLAAKYADGKPWKISTLDESLEFLFTWKVIPINQVREHEGCPLAISEWVDGLSVQDLLDRQDELGELDHPLQRINAIDYGGIQGDMTEFCGPLNTELRTSNIWFTTVNTKPKGSQLVITDVCPSVRNLHSLDN